MNRTAATIATLIVTGALAVTSGGSAQASTPLPRCAARTVDAVAHGTPLTPAGTVCEVWYGDYIPPTWPVVSEITSGLGTPPVFLSLRSPVLPPLCVTTEWRAEHTGQPKTRRGHTCRFEGVSSDAPMWLPKSWKIVGEWLDDSGQIQWIVVHPRARHHHH